MISIVEAIFCIGVQCMVSDVMFAGPPKPEGCLLALTKARLNLEPQGYHLESSKCHALGDGDEASNDGGAIGNNYSDVRWPAGKEKSPEAAFFQSLKQPGTGASCCDVADCYRVPDGDYRQVGNRWQFLFSREVFGAGADGDWRDIPEKAILQRKDNPTGTLVLCGHVGGMGIFMVWCAVLPYLV